MPIKKDEQPTTPTDNAVSLSNGTGQLGNEPSLSDTDSLATPSPETPGNEGDSAEADGEAQDEPVVSEVSDELVEAEPVTGDEVVDAGTVADPTPVEDEIDRPGKEAEIGKADIPDGNAPNIIKVLASNYEEGAEFESFTTPDGAIWGISILHGRFTAESEDKSYQVVSDLSDTIEDLHKHLEKSYPANKNPFTGQDESVRRNAGIEGDIVKEDKPDPVAKKVPSVRLDLDYGQYLNAISWLPQAIANVGGQLNPNSDTKECHLRLHSADDFKPEWSHLLKVQQAVEEDGA